MRSLRIFGRALLVLVVALAVLITTSVVIPVARATDTRTLVALRADVPFLPEGTPLEVTLGVGTNRTQIVDNGDDFDAEGTPDATGMITATDPGGELVAIGVAPKIPGLVPPRRPLNDESSAVGMVFSIPGFAGFTVLEDAMLVDAAYAVPELQTAAAALAKQRAAGTNPLVEPTPETLDAVARLFAAADAELGRRLDTLLAGFEPAAAKGLAGNDQLSFVPAIATTSPPAATPAIDVDGLPQACEDGVDDPSACGNDRDEKPCEVKYPGVVQDVDHRDGDAVCIVAKSFDPASNKVDLAGTNFLARWSLVYTASNASLLPDAMIAPKRWSLPSVKDFTVDVLELTGETALDGIRTTNWFADRFATVVLRQDELKGDFGQRLSDRFWDMVRQYITLPTSDFSLSVGEPGQDPVGARFTTYAFGWPRESLGSQADRWLLSLAMTAVTEWAIPGIRLALDIQKSFGGTSICRPFSTKSKNSAVVKGIATRNEEPTDICTALLDMSAVLVPAVADILASQDDPEAGDYISVAGEILSVFFAVAQDVIDPKLDGYLSKVKLGKVKVAKELLQVEGSTATDEATDRLAEGSTAVVDGVADGDAVADMVKAALTGIVVFALGSSDIGEITAEIIGVIVERAMKALIPSVGTIATIIDTVDVVIGTINILGGVAEIILKRSADTQDTYIITVAGLNALPLSPDALPKEGTPAANGVSGTTVLVMDVSGSMGDYASTEQGVGDSPKIDGARAAAHALTSVAAIGGASGVSQSVGLVAFSDSAETLALPTQDAASVEEQIDGLGPTNGTNIESGLQAALAALSGVTGPRRIVLLSDGADTVDATGAHILSGSVVTARDEGIPIDTIAFDLQDQVATGLMSQIAAETGGNFGEASSASDLARLFISSQHAATGKVIQSINEPMTGDSATVSLVVPGDDAGAGPQEMLVTVVLGGAEFEVILRDANGSQLDPSAIKVTNGKGSTSVTVFNPPPGTLSLTVRRTGPVPDVDTSTANTAVFDEATGRIVLASSTVLTSDRAAVAADDGATQDLVVVASVSGTAETRATAVPEPEQRLAAMAAAATWAVLLLVLALLVAVRMRRRTA
jgi:Mg-chelatase subunit ChlD